MYNIVYVDKAESTSSLLAETANQYKHGTALAAHEQTAGRGQRGNHWESEPEKNLTFSVLLRPNILAAARQFEISQIVSIAITKVLRRCLETEEVKIKWPNDIYYKDKKICGILIENTITGAHIDRSIVGIGINVNQEKFLSDAPNPISLYNITNKTFDLEYLLEDTVAQIVCDFNEYERNPRRTLLAANFRQMLWRGEGTWPFHDNITDEDIMARVAAIDPSGLLTLVTDEGEFRTYSFKEVTSII